MMDRMRRMISAPWRLGLAMRAQGVGPVLDFVVLTVRQRGALDALRLGMADRRRREAVAEEDLARDIRPAGRRAGPGARGGGFGGGARPGPPAHPSQAACMAAT